MKVFARPLPSLDLLAGFGSARGQAAWLGLVTESSCFAHYLLRLPHDQDFLPSIDGVGGVDGVDGRPRIRYWDIFGHRLDSMGHEGTGYLCRVLLAHTLGHA
jgi:hypothetical protein